MAVPGAALVLRCALRAAGLLAAGLAAGCTPAVELPPGPAHPAASADDSFPLRDGEVLHTVNDVNVVLPQGWEPVGSDGCLAPPPKGGHEDPPPPDPDGACPPTALRIATSAAEEGAIDPDGAALSRPDGWLRPWVDCPGAVAGGPAPELVEHRAHDGFELVSGERVATASWRLDCSGSVPFTVRIWYVPEADLELGAVVGEKAAAADYERIVRSMDLSRHAG